jgi:DnaJ-class molecular chaperone
MPNDWETVCERIAEYMSDGPVMPARQPDREVILGFINHSEAERKRCPKCGGSCTVFVPNRNPLHDSEIEVACDECGGRGFIR